MTRVYCLSGLGADERIFRNLRIRGAELVHLSWVGYDRKDTLPAYAAKMAALIPEKDPVILGLSFGGMLATEIAKNCNAEKVFLVSSAKTKYELPVIGGVLGLLLGAPVIPSFVYTIPNFYIDKLFGARTQGEKALLHGIIREADGGFVKWALQAIGKWHNETVPPNIIHIHGTRDDVLPSARSAPDIWIEGGTHIMIYNRADEIAAIIEKELAKK